MSAQRKSTKVTARFKKTDEASRMVYGEVYAPMALDSHGEFMLPEDVVLMAHRFMSLDLSKTIDTNHDNVPNGSKPIESFIAAEGDPDFAAGSWVLGVKVSAETWPKVKSGELNAYSFEAMVLPVSMEVEVKAGGTPVKAHALTDPRPLHVSMVKRGANMTDFVVVKTKAQGPLIAAVNGAPVSAHIPGRPGPRNLPDAESGGAPTKARDPLAGAAFASAIGVSRKSATPRTVKFERKPAGDLALRAALGLRRKAKPKVIAYCRDDAPASLIERFQAADADEVRREGRHGRTIRDQVVYALSKHDVLLLEKIGDLANPAALDSLVSALKIRGAHVVSFDGVDTRTPAGRAKLANLILAAKQLFYGASL